jgi:hypothetical protein
MPGLKFISVVAILITNSRVRCRTASPGAKHDGQACRHHEYLVEFGAGDVPQLLRRLPWAGCQKQRPGSFGAEDGPRGPDHFGTEEWRKVPGISHCRCSSRSGTHSVAWRPGHADLGPLFSSISQGGEAQVQQRITNLVTYIESLQEK